MILVYLGRWSYGRFKDDNNIFYKMKNDLTARTWQDDIWCPIIIILFCTSDDGMANKEYPTQIWQERREHDGARHEWKGKCSEISRGKRAQRKHGSTQLMFLMVCGSRQLVIKGAAALRDASMCQHKILEWRGIAVVRRRQKFLSGGGLRSLGRDEGDINESDRWWSTT